MPLRRTASVWIPLLGALVAALWPLTSYKLGPVFLPLVLASAAALVLIVTRPAYGLAGVMALAPLTNLHTGGSKYFHVLLPVMCVGLLLYGALVARSERLHVRALTFSVLFFLAASVASAFAAVEPSKAITKLIVIAAASAFFFAVIEVCRTRREAI